MGKRIFLCLLAVVLLGVLVTAFLAVNSLSVSIGPCLVADNGSVLLIRENSPIVLSLQGGAEFPVGLSDGDRLLVLHDGIQESYPGGTGAYFILRLGHGSPADIPDAVTGELRELGWIS